jgi:hypothetical protein
MYDQGCTIPFFSPENHQLVEAEFISPAMESDSILISMCADDIFALMIVICAQSTSIKIYLSVKIM